MTPVGWLDPFDLIASLPRRMGLFGESDRFGERIATNIDFAKWPELALMIEKAESVAIESWRLRMLDPGAILPWRKPKPDAPARIIMPLRTNPGLLLFDPLACNPMVLGQLLLVTPGKPTSAMNLGETNYIGLVIEVRRKEDGYGREDTRLFAPANNS